MHSEALSESIQFKGVLSALAETVPPLNRPTWISSFTKRHSAKKRATTNTSTQPTWNRSPPLVQAPTQRSKTLETATTYPFAPPKAKQTDPGSWTISWRTLLINLEIEHLRSRVRIGGTLLLQWKKLLVRRRATSAIRVPEAGIRSWRRGGRLVLDRLGRRNLLKVQELHCKKDKMMMKTFLVLSRLSKKLNQEDLLQLLNYLSQKSYQFKIRFNQKDLNNY